jgi:hypothetical protein
MEASGCSIYDIVRHTDFMTRGADSAWVRDTEEESIEGGAPAVEIARFGRLELMVEIEPVGYVRSRHRELPPGHWIQYFDSPDARHDLSRHPALHRRPLA